MKAQNENNRAEAIQGKFDELFSDFEENKG